MEKKTLANNRYYVLALLTLVYTFNHIDRQILTILLEPIRMEFNLSDTALGVLTGIAFALFYATLGIPVALWADRGNRRNILALSLTIWSGMTALSGMASNFTHLLLARIGVGIGEAGGTPPATSIIADLFPPEKRATALGVYTTGISFGILAGFLIGGFIYEAYGWRMAFFVAGIPGLFLAAIVRFTLNEPVRGLSEQREATEKAPGMRDILSFLKKQKSAQHLLFGGALICIVANGWLAMIAPYLIRNFDISVKEAGISLAILIGVFGGLGAIIFGHICDRLSQQSLAWRPRMIMLATAISLPFQVAFLFSDNIWIAYAFYAVPSLLGLLYASLAYTAMQELFPLRMRAFAAALMLFCLTLVGIGGGPVIVGALSDMFKDSYGDASLKYGLLIVLGFSLWSLFHLRLAERDYMTDVEKAKKY